MYPICFRFIRYRMLYELNRWSDEGFTFLVSDVSISSVYSLVQMLFFRLMYLQLAFLWTCRYFLHCLSCTIASSTCPFYTLQILPAKILHPQSALSTPCRYSQLKFCILTSRKSTITDISPILWTPWPVPIRSLPKNWYKKFERIWNERWWHLERKFLR